MRIRAKGKNPMMQAQNNAKLPPSVVTTAGANNNNVVITAGHTWVAAGNAGSELILLLREIKRRAVDIAQRALAENDLQTALEATEIAQDLEALQNERKNKCHL